jgi:hypothetical protein
MYQDQTNAQMQPRRKTRRDATSCMFAKKKRSKPCNWCACVHLRQARSGSKRIAPSFPRRIIRKPLMIRGCIYTTCKPSAASSFATLCIRRMVSRIPLTHALQRGATYNLHGNTRARVPGFSQGLNKNKMYRLGSTKQVTVKISSTTVSYSFQRFIVEYTTPTDGKRVRTK